MIDKKLDQSFSYILSLIDHQRVDQRSQQKLNKLENQLALVTELWLDFDQIDDSFAFALPIGFWTTPDYDEKWFQ